MKKATKSRLLTMSCLAAAAFMSTQTLADPGNGNGNGNGVQNWTNNPYHPAYDHPYRHGAIPTVEGKSKIDQWNQEFFHKGAAFASTQPSASAGQLTYGGGISGVGVNSGQSRVYLVFYGTQWGTSSTDANGNLAFSADTYGAASAVQQMFKGIGTNNETWSAELTQWCDGPNIASGATSCPSNANFIPYQQNVLAGVWYDNASASPAQATGAQLASEAVRAASHFGNTASGSNRYTYYVILSPPGTNPDNYKSTTNGFCAWHDYTGDGYGQTVTNIAFSNQPYNMELGTSCGVGFVNGSTNGKLDGYTMTLGHEWHEYMSDQFPAGGWTNKTGGTLNGQENSDECAWLSPGTAGGAANITFATGTFAEQASWSNDTGNCAISHAILTHGGGGTPTANFSFTTSGLTANFTDSSTDSGGTIGSHSWNFGDGTTSTATNPSHTYATANSYTVTETVADSVNTSATSTATKTVTVSSGGGGGSTQLLGNTSFESTASWSSTAGVICSTGCSGESAHTGVGFSWLDGYGSTHTDTLSQTVTIPAGKTTGTLSFYLHIDTAETTTTTAYDKLTVQVGGTTVATFSNLNKNTGYAVHSYNVPVTAGSSVTVKFTGTEDSSLQTSFVIDDVTFTAQ